MRTRPAATPGTMHDPMPLWTRRALLVLLGMLLLLFLLVAVGYRVSWLHYDEALTQLRARSARLDGVLQSGSRIETQLAEARASVRPWLFPGGEGAENDATQRLRELVLQSGATLVSSQAVLVPATQGGLAYARLSATMSGEWTQLVSLAAALQRHRPAFWVRSGTLMREGADAPGAPQKARLVIQVDAPLAPSAEPGADR